MLEWIRKFLTRKQKLKTGDLVQDIGDSFHAVEDPGIVIEVYKDRYSYRHPLFFGLLKVNYDGIVVRWLDKKGTSHVYPSPCVKKLELSEERAEKLKVQIEERFNKPKKPPEPLLDEQLKIPFDWQDLAEELDTEPTPAIEPVEPETEEKPSLNKMQEKLREVQRIVEERARTQENSEE